MLVAQAETHARDRGWTVERRYSDPQDLSRRYLQGALNEAGRIDGMLVVARLELVADSLGRFLASLHWLHEHDAGLVVLDAGWDDSRLDEQHRRFMDLLADLERSFGPPSPGEPVNPLCEYHHLALPYGWGWEMTEEGAILVADIPAQTAIRWAAELRDLGATWPEIAWQLQEAGFPPPPHITGEERGPDGTVRRRRATRWTPARARRVAKYSPWLCQVDALPDDLELAAQRGKLPSFRSKSKKAAQR